MLRNLHTDARLIASIALDALKAFSVGSPSLHSLYAQPTAAVSLDPEAAGKFRNDPELPPLDKSGRVVIVSVNHS